MHKYAVRPAQLEDIQWMLPQLENFSDFYGTHHQLFGTAESSAQVVQFMIEKHVVFVCERSDVGPIGFISGFVNPHIYNPDMNVLTEAWWWVLPEFRGTKAGLLLLNSFTEWGKENVDWITFALPHHSPANDACLLRRGYKLQEKTFLLEIT